MERLDLDHQAINPRYTNGRPRRNPEAGTGPPNFAVNKDPAWFSEWSQLGLDAPYHSDHTEISGRYPVVERVQSQREQSIQPEKNTSPKPGTKNYQKRKLHQSESLSG